MTKLTVAVVSYNAAAALARCLESVKNSKYSGSLRIVVVDNASTDNSLDVARAVRDVEVMSLAENIYYSRANNLVWHASSSPYFTVLNSDCFVEPDTLAVAVEHLDQHPDAAIVSVPSWTKDGDLENGHVRGFHSPGFALLWYTALGYVLSGLRARGRRVAYVDYYRTTTRTVDFVQGSFLVVRRAAVNGDLFDPSMLMYFSDEDLCRRVKQQGWRVDYVTDSHVVHASNTSVLGSDPEKIRRLYLHDISAFYTKHGGALYAKILMGAIRISELIPGYRAGPRLWAGYHDPDRWRRWPRSRA